jgi:hypothetical protein
VASEACLKQTQKTKCEHKMMVGIFTDLLTDKPIDPNKKTFQVLSWALLDDQHVVKKSRI